MSASHYIIIVGCGRLGSLLANQLSAQGHQVVIIDHREAMFDKLSHEFSGFRVVGDAIEMSVLRQARPEMADYLLAITTQDNTNLMVAQIAKRIFGIPKVIARVYDPEREQLYREFGIDTISPTKLAAQTFLGRIE